MFIMDVTRTVINALHYLTVVLRKHCSLRFFNFKIPSNCFEISSRKVNTLKKEYITKPQTTLTRMTFLLVLSCGFVMYSF